MRNENRIALLVGINEYCDGIGNLSCCENDVKGMEELLGRHEDGKPNFLCKRLIGSETKVSKKTIEESIKKVIAKEPDFALFYFSGHGGIENEKNGYLICQDTPVGKPGKGIHMNWVLKRLSDAKIPEVIVILDCCHSGNIGSVDLFQEETAQLRKGVTLLCASASKGFAVERKGFGVFTSIVCEGLRGVAADISGHVTAASLYSMADSILTPWDQRPIYKSYVTHMKPIRFCEPQYPPKQLRRITHHFSKPADHIVLSPAHLATSSFTDPALNGIFQDLLAFYHLGLVQGERVTDISQEAKINGNCKLTPYGKFFWETVKKELV